VTIAELCEKSHENAVKHGFWDGVMDTPIHRNSVLMLIVSEVGEACEALRCGDDANFAEELADVAIRLGDACGAWDIDLEAEIVRKMAKNKSRSRKHGKKF
jgi:NTP pyrophosphatase (non-canonical NTP hydrolase)